jgi:hypothetical protein
MSIKYPYVPSSGPIAKTFEHLRRKKFPNELNVETLRRLGVAPQNESYVINVLRFIGVIDEDGKKVDGKADAFFHHKDEEFERAIEALVRDSYQELFELHGDDAWTMDRGALTQFFRTSDRSSDSVGSRQTATFQYLAAAAGHRELPQKRKAQQRKPSEKKATPGATKTGERAAKGAARKPAIEGLQESRVGLTVRIEVNLPAGGDQETYDNIFQSIRKNFIDGK